MALKKTIVMMIAALVLVLAGRSVHAAPPAAEEYEIAEDAGPLEKLDFEKRLEERLTKDVESYLGHRRFIFKIDAQLSRIKTILRKPYLVSPGPAQPPAQPQTAFDGQAPLPGENGEPPMLLPGMPVEITPKKPAREITRQPEGRQSPQEQNASRQPVYDYRDEVFGVKTYFKKIAISFVVDKNISGEQEEFIRNLIFHKAQLDTIRGDTLQITRADFPQPLAPASPWNKYIDYLPYIVVLFFIFLLLILLAVVIGQRRNSRKRPDAEPQAATPLPLAARALETAAAPSPEKKDDRLAHLRQELIALGLGQPELVRKKAREEMDSGGVERVALLYQGIGFNLARSLFTSLLENEQAEIKKHLDAARETDDEALFEAMNDFYHKTIYESLLHSSKKTELKPFGFLDELDDSQIKYLLEYEDIRVKALVLSQLNPTRTAAIIRTYPPEERGKIAVALGDFESIPISAFRDVADRLSKKAIGLPSFANISADGIGLLVDVFDNLDGATERSLLELLKTQNPSTYHKLKQVYFTFWDIPRVPQSSLKDVLREIDRRTLALCLVDVEPDFKSFFLEGLSEKMRIMVEDEIEGIGKAYVQKNVDDARLAITKKIRLQMQKEGVSLAE